MRCKSCQTSNQMYFNVISSFSKTKDELVIGIDELFSGVLLHGVSNKPEGYLTQSITYKWVFLQE